MFVVYDSGPVRGIGPKPAVFCGLVDFYFNIFIWFFSFPSLADFSPKVDASQPKSPSGKHKYEKILTRRAWLKIHTVHLYFIADVVDYATDDFTHQDLSAVNSKSKSPSTSTAFMPSSGSRTSSSSAFFFFFSVLLYPLSGLFSTHSMRWSGKIRLSHGGKKFWHNRRRSVWRKKCPMPSPVGQPKRKRRRK